jgi:pimeloyl-ACP methyl ester carboxylesterase
MSESGTFEPDGRAVPYAVEGEGPVTLVLLAAGGVEGDGLGVIAHYLAEEAGFRVARVGSRSGSDASGTSVADRVADTVDVTDHLGITHTWVGGHAFGGTIAREFAAAHHERVNGLLLMGVEESQAPLAPAIPVLIIQGSDDDVTPPENGEQLRMTAPERSSVTTLDGAGHHFPATHPIETAVIIEEYLDWD